MSQPSLYESNPDRNVILQGDIFPEIDFYVPLPTSVKLEPPPSSSVIRDGSFSEEQISSQVNSKKERRLMTIITQSCDITDEDSLLVSPVYTIEEYIRFNPKNFQSNLALIRKRKGLFDKFYLENIILPGNISVECYINLKVVNLISRNSVNTSQKIASLSHWGRHVLNHQLMWLFGRPIVEWTP